MDLSPDSGGSWRGRAARRRDRAAAAPVLSARRRIPAAGHVRPAVDPRGRHSPAVGRSAAVRRSGDGRAAQHPDRRLDLSRLQPRGHRSRRRRRGRPLGGDLPHQIRRHAARDLAGSPHGFGAGTQCRLDLRLGVRDRLFHGGARRRHHRTEPGGGARHGHRGAHSCFRGRGHRRARQSAGRAGRGADRELRAHRGHPVLPRDRTCRALSHRGRGTAVQTDRFVRNRVMTATAVSHAQYRPKLLLFAAAVVLVLLALLPSYLGLYQTQLLTYGLIAAIAALGFNLLLGYTGLLSFGHSAFFGMGAYSAAFLLRDAGIHSMELYILIGLPITAVVSALFGYICVRHTRIFFGILTLALSQVLWTLAYKFFWVTGGSDGLRVARPTLLAGTLTFTGGGSFQRFINAYYYYVLGVFAICVVIMWVIVHSPFGKALQAIRDNETRAAFLGLRISRFRWVSFLISGTFTGLAGILWVPLNGLTTPEVMYWPFSGEIVFMTLLGGFRNFTGPIVGGLLFTYLKTYAVATTEYWQLLLGVVLVLLVMLLPTGIVGAISAVAGKLRPREKSS